MRNQPYYAYNPAPEYSPLRENYILRVDDIPGAKPRHAYANKNTGHYEQRLSSNNSNDVFQTNLQIHEKLYALGNYHQGYNPHFSNKRHYVVHQESEIARTGALNGRESAPPDLHHADYPRNLNTRDIPGAVPGSLQSRTVKNHDLAHKLRGSSVTPPKVPTTTDTLDKSKRGQSVNEEEYKFNIPPRDSYPAPRSTNFHYAQNQAEQPKPASKENYYSGPPAILKHPQQDNRDSVNPNEQSLDEGRKAKHVAFKEEPRGHVSEVEEQPPQFREQQSALKEYPNSCKERTSELYKRDCLDTYVAQHCEYNSNRQPNVNDQSFQDYHNTSNISNPRPSYGSKRDHLEQLSKEIMAQQLALERKAKETIRGRAFNIVSNTPLSYIQFENRRRPYGSSIKALTKNQEDFARRDNSAARVWSQTPELNSSSRQEDMSAHSYLEPRKPMYAAGAVNDYLDSSFRNGNNNSAQLPPISQAQYYGSKAIKNLNAMNAMKPYY